MRMAYSISTFEAENCDEDYILTLCRFFATNIRNLFREELDFDDLGEHDEAKENDSKLFDFDN
jgi:hypothetical protein